MGRYLREDQFQEIKRRFAEGETMKDLAKEYKISESTVSNYVHGRTSPRKRLAGRSKVDKSNTIHNPKKYAVPMNVSTPFADLPEDMFFMHVRGCHFIG